MLRNIKALGLTLAAMLAMSAMAASAAYATEDGRIVTAFDTETHETSHVFGTDVGESRGLEFTAFGGAVECAENNFHGTVEGGTATELTLLTEFGGPKATQKCGGLPSTTDNNGCHLSFGTFETGEGQNWSATMDLACPAGVAGVQWTTFLSGSHSTPICTTTIPPQSGIERATVHNKANTLGDPHDLTLTMEATNIKMKRSGSFCATEETSSAQMHGELTMTAENSADEPIDLYVEHHE